MNEASHYKPFSAIRSDLLKDQPITAMQIPKTRRDPQSDHDQSEVQNNLLELLALHRAQSALQLQGKAPSPSPTYESGPQLSRAPTSTNYGAGFRPDKVQASHRTQHQSQPQHKPYPETGTNMNIPTEGNNQLLGYFGANIAKTTSGKACLSCTTGCCCDFGCCNGSYCMNENDDSTISQVK